ncbi:MAG: hypothetical protein H6624_09390 [Bdellovibrionaceae bacterium]|nr:hypothetical protein [Bdellovibrionales bacterium]MCB9084548.1 hypothetical protein [Pseudobdellovibrionaceae bacterium]
MKSVVHVVLAWVLMSSVAQAAESYCTDWKLKDGYSCIFAGKSGDIFVRQCFHKDDKQKVCVKEGTHPSDFANGCSEWVRVPGVSCSNGYDFEDKWVRSCDHSDLRQQICTDENPNNWGDN